MISLRGKPNYVVMTKEQYDYLPECELLAAMAETEKDMAAGAYKTMTAAEYIQVLRKDLQESE